MALISVCTTVNVDKDYILLERVRAEINRCRIGKIGGLVKQIVISANNTEALILWEVDDERLLRQ
mgnify:CR=1 FL=1